MSSRDDVSEDERREMIERLRRSGIAIDRQGELVHEGAPFLHEGLRRALFRWLDRLPPPDGRYILRLDERRFAYIDVADTPLVARAARIEGAGARVTLALSDGSDETLDPTTLTIDEAGVLRCWVRGGRLEARLATSAVVTLAELIREPGPTIVVGGKAVEIRRRSAGAP